MNKLLIEIGTEEIPAGYIVPALNAFKKSIIAAFDKYRINHGRAQVFGTPRRLALMVEDLAEQQNPKTSTITGPPEKIGYDENKNPTIGEIGRASCRERV